MVKYASGMLQRKKSRSRLPTPMPAPDHLALYNLYELCCCLLAAKQRTIAVSTVCMQDTALHQS